MIKRLAAASVVALLGMSSVLIGGGPAHAEPVTVICGGTTTTEFSPGLLLTAQTVTYEESNIFSPCVSTTHPSLTAGNSVRPPIDLELSCLSFQDASTSTRTINWNTEQSSLFRFNSTSSNIGGQTVLTRTGFIESGLFAGANAVQTITSPSLDLASCLFPPGIEERLGVTTLSITSLS